MAYNQQMAERFRAALAGQGAIKENYMFGALGFVVNGKLTACIGEKDAMFKLSQDRCAELIDQNIAKSVVMGKRTMKGWINIDFEHLQDDAQIKAYLSEAMQYIGNVK